LGQRADIALLALRLAVGVAFVLHGYPKIQHPLTWMSSTVPGTPAFLQAIAAFAEFAGGIALVVGFATPLFAFLIACDMLVAIFVVLIPHGAVFVSDDPAKPSFELALIYLVCAVAIILIGAGAYSIDSARSSRERPMPPRSRRR
jgi:putative oxidoreductase